MKKLLFLCVILALSGLAKASSVYYGLDVYKDSFCTVDEGEQLKRIMTQYSDWLNNYIVLLKQGATASYKTQIWLSQDDDPIRSAYVVKPNAENVILNNDRPGHFSYKPDGLNYVYSIADLKSQWPSGDYVLHVTFTNGSTQTFTATIPDYDTTPFPDIVNGSLSTDAQGQLSLDWSTVDGVNQYNVWAWKLKTNTGVYESADDGLYDYVVPPQSFTTPLTGAYVGKYDLNIGVTAEKNVTGGQFSVTFNSVANWFSFKKPAAPIVNSIDKVTVKAGAGASKDSISFTGSLDAIAADLIIAKQDGNNITVFIGSDNMPSLLEFTFPITDATFKKGVYSGTDALKTQSFKFDTKTGKMSFSAKNINLKGLSCPIFVGIVFGDYGVKFNVDASVVNGGKAAPPTLLMGVADSIKVTKATIKQGKNPQTDSLMVTGTFTTAEGVNYNKANAFAVEVDGGPYTIAGSQMATKGSTESCTKALCNEGGLLTAKLDFAKGTFTITLAGIDIGPGEQDFGLNVFGIYLPTIINDRFVGTHKMTLYGNNNLGDGFALETEKITATISTSNNIDYALKVKGTPTMTLARTSDNFIELDPQPQVFADWSMLNMDMLSDGFNRAFMAAGKDFNPQDVSIHVGAWTSKASVTSAQLAGTWIVSWIYQDDILANYLNRFDSTEETLTITDLGNKQVKVEGTSFFTGATTLTLAGNTLVLSGLDPSIKYFSMVTNGNGIAIAVIEVNGGVVSARIGLASAP